MSEHHVKCVLLDIEGTVCPISFVKDTLFPYAIQALPQVLATQWNSPDFIPYRQAFPAEHASTPEALQAHVQDLTTRDVKIAYLKNLQGYLWRDGYKSGTYSTPLFPDVVPALKSWREDEGKTLAIYSSGSVDAQKLLFEHVQKDAKGDGTAIEDLRPLISDWFDTVNAGLKMEVPSYEKIAAALKLDPSTILFLSDNIKEVDAAIAAGMRSVVVDRPGNAPITSEDQSRRELISSLSELRLV